MKKRVHIGKFKRNRRFRHRRVQRNVKDRLFRFLFANDAEALLQLYNALNGTNYTEASQLQIVTIESAVYVVMKNDLAFVLSGTLNMYEHQSTFSLNLPVRFLIYLAQEYQTIIERAEESIYGTKQIKLPAPQCVVFYNGTRDMPEEQTLRLSDAFGDKKHKADVELTVRVYNINYGHNRELLDKCRMLGEYSEFVDIARKYVSDGGDAETALSAAIDYCIEHGVLEDILRKNRSEVLGMLLEEFDIEKYERSLKREGLEAGIKQGIEQGMRNMIETLQEAGWTEESTANKIAEKFMLSSTEAERKVAEYWKQK
ncbi:MAG: hypothetical protein NC429_01760 [Lachnospiraceae bacterium]|nr:hypothetical protein [Lachnospiraceae bacterium]